MNFKECMNVLCTLHSKIYTNMSSSMLMKINAELSQLHYCEIKHPNEKFTYKLKDEIDKLSSVTFNTFHQIKEILENTNQDVSLQYATLMKTSITNLTSLAICANLMGIQPGRISYQYSDNTILEKYQRLCSSTDKLIKLLKSEQLCDIILTSCLRSLITALYQIIYAPIKKPLDQKQKSEDSFVMTVDLYNKLTDDRSYFQEIVKVLLMPKIKSQYVTTIMLLMKCKTPAWFQRAVSINLTSIMRDKGGIETIATCLLENTTDYDPHDTSKIWQTLNILVKLFLGFQASADFTSNICKQLLNLLNMPENRGIYIDMFELIVAKCIKDLYIIDQITAVDILLNELYSKAFLSIIDIPNSGVILDNLENDFTSAVSQSTRILHNCFIHNHVDSVNLPVSLLSPIVVSILKFHASTVKCLPIISDQLKDLLLKYAANEDIGHKLFDAVLFDMGFPATDVYLLRRDVVITVDTSRIVLKTTNTESIENVDESLDDDLINLIETRNDLLINLFGYLFECLVDRTKSTNNLKIYESIMKLSCNKSILQHLNSNPECLIHKFELFLEYAISIKMHMNNDNTASDELQPFCTVIMIVQLLAQCNIRETAKLLNLFRLIGTETNIAEIKLLISDVLNKITGDEYVSPTAPSTSDGQVMIASEVDKAITEVCDPLLPVRAHGLLELTRLVENRHPDVLKRKGFVFNVFQQNLKNEDSFIYLNAIGGLAAMGKLFPYSILPLLADEYADYRIYRVSEDETELKLKLGEVLLRVTKSLGDRAYKHKALLLNTFLKTTKDDHPLIRASSLSNMAEVCKVLGGKMGPIIAEVISCIQYVIEMDTAPEPRRAALTVVRQMLVGTDKEMLRILRFYMPVIYRTVQSVYKNDADEVTRLQAQLALEQLTLNMNAIVMPKY